MSKHKKEGINFKNIACIILTYLPLIFSVVGIFLLFNSPYLGTKINLMISGVILLLSAIVILCFILGKKKAIRNLTIFAIVLSILCSSAIAYADYLYFRLHYELGKISSTQEYVYSYIYALKDSAITAPEELTGKKLGLQSSTSTTCYSTVIEGLNKKGIAEGSYTIETYSNFVTAAGDLMNKKVDAIAVDEQGLSMIGEIYPEFAKTTVQIASYKQTIDNSNSSTSVNMSTEPFTVLINGVDSRDGDLSSGSNADVIMLATFNPKTLKLSMISIPRDTYIPVTCRGNINDKITHSGSGGVTCTIDSLEETLGITINYYVKVNFNAVVNLVDAIGGIDVTVPLSFCEQDSKDTPDALCINEGYQHLNGEQALALSRHRKTLPNGDIGRGVNQQIVIEGMISKLASGQILTSLDSLLSVLGNNVQTNMKQSDMYGLFSLLTSLGSKSTFSNTSALSISSSTIAGYDSMIYTDWAGAEIYYYIPYKESLQAAATEIRRIMGLEDYPLPSSKFSFNANEPYDQYNFDTTNGLNDAQ
ncbi:MAG: LCP family protein [Beduini sp.]|uniref:LCP family protein n=1 Tax=Beduini sp. TaxID=1922300 RepID=UPI0011C93998